ncbi:capsular polysaccharide transport system permease protein [Celeribacter persicus]|uniref:Transport permease protein n=2 Tax=Celeribacter persicus TaxID=1651082 RepID=A0A2T5HTT9_9RHOB|nr:capsular polysaccharide transport system permease protein [Celeribacter persicus]
MSMAGHSPSLGRAVRTISALMLREMATNYGRTPGGYLWAILEPVAGITLITIFFSLAFHQPPIGEHFILFYASGILPFTMYKDMSTKIGRAISFNEKLLSYPSVTFMDAILARLMLNALTQVMIFCLMFGAILLFTGTDLRHLNPSMIALALCGVIVFSFGIGVINALLFEKLPVWEQIWAILNRPMFLISTIFYQFENIPDAFRPILWFNPLVHIVGVMRRGIYPTYDADFVSLPYIFGPPLVLSAFGILFLRAFHNGQ